VFGEGIPGSKPPDFTKMQGIRGGSPLPSLTPAVPPKPATPAGGDTGAIAQKPTGSQAAVPKSGANGGANNGPPGDSAATAPKPKPRPTAPILVTDPTDADPGSDVVPSGSPKPPAIPPPSATPPPATPKPPVPRNP
jgi:hypothetical protein